MTRQFPEATVVCLPKMTALNTRSIASTIDRADDWIGAKVYAKHKATKRNFSLGFRDSTDGIQIVGKR